MLNFGTFLLMQSPSALPSVEIYARAIEHAQAAEELGFRNIWFAEHHFSMYGYLGVPVERMGEFRKLFDRKVAELKPPCVPEVGVQRAVYVTDNVADARDAAEHARWNMRVTLSLRNHYEQVQNGRAVPVPAPSEPDTDDLLDRFLVIGTPDTVIRQINRIKDLVGINHFNCSFWFGDLSRPRVMKSMELFAREVMPALT